MPRYHIGLSAGSSLFGVDAALVRIEGVGATMKLHLEQFLHLPYGNDLRELLIRVHQSPSPELRHLATLHRVLGETFALAALQVLENKRLAPADLYCIGCSPQGLWHDPDGRYPASLNLGMPSVVAERTGLTTVADFSSRDLAVGGQGNSMTALADTLMFHQPGENRVIVHLGGVAAVTSLPAQLGTNWRHVSAYDAVPCTLLLDGAMRLLSANRVSYDVGGKNAVQGRCLDALLQRWLADSFVQRPPPKSVSRRDFGPDFLTRAVEQARREEGSLRDLLCTMTHFIARVILRSLQQFLPVPPTRILLSGRGVRNGFLWHILEQNLGTLSIEGRTPIPSMEKTDAHGIPAEARKAVAFAALAALTMDGLPSSLPTATGATGPRLLGHITPGASGNWARCLAWMARQTAPLQLAA